MADEKRNPYPVVQLSEYDPVLALAEPTEEDTWILNLSDQALEYEGGRWAPLHGLRVKYYPIEDLPNLVDLRILDALQYIKWSDDGSAVLEVIPPIHNPVYWLLTCTYPGISFDPYPFTPGEMSGIYDKLKDPKNHLKPRSKETISEKILPINFQNKTLGGYRVIQSTAPPKIKSGVLKELRALQQERLPFLATLDPEYKVFPHEMFGLKPDIVRALETGVWESTGEDEEDLLKSLDVRVMADCDEQAVKALLQAGINPVLKGRYFTCYAIPSTYQAPPEGLEQQILDHVGLPLEIKKLRRVFVRSQGHFDHGEFSAEYVKNGSSKDSNRVKRQVIQASAEKISEGEDPLSYLDPGKKIPQGYEQAMFGQVSMYIGPAWCMEATLEDQTLPEIFFVELDVFHKYCLDHIPACKEKFQINPPFIYIGNSSWCERNTHISNGKAIQESDYHSPAVNGRSLADWIYGPMIHYLQGNGYKFKSVQVLAASDLSDLTSALSAYEKVLSKVTQANKEMLTDDFRAAFAEQLEKVMANKPQEAVVED